MKKGVKKFIIAIIIAIMIFNVFFPIATWAADTHLNLDGLDDVALKGVDGIVGILHYLPKVTIYAIAKIAWTAISALVTGAEHWNLTPDDIIFSGATGAKEIDLIDLSFFNSPDGVTKNVADGISQWYIALRNLVCEVERRVIYSTN